ncbi:MAG: hypothetical protein OHK0044_21350 [Burkholderiaceae bacterium]
MRGHAIKKTAKNALRTVLMLSGLAVAATYGPFSIQDFARSNAVSGAYAADEPAFPLANAFFKQALNAQYGHFRPGDWVRIRYDDGVIAEFALSAYGVMCSGGACKWSTTVPMIFQTVVQSAAQPATFDYPGVSACFASRPLRIETGYWGQRGEVDPEGRVIITAAWVSTGFVEIRPSRRTLCS